MSRIKLFYSPWRTLVLFIFLWFGILIVTGTINSGFHLTDDHDVIRIKNELSQTSLSHEIQSIGKELFSSKLRFRPFYTLHRRLITAVFGGDFLLWSIYTGLLAALTTFFLFRFMQRIGFAQMGSLFFSFLVLFGEQSAIWWKLGANETLGMFILSIALFYMAAAADPITTLREKRRNEFLFILFAILASWSKESFVLMIPAIIYWKIWLTVRNGKITGEPIHMPDVPIFQAIKKNKISILILLLLFFWESYHILTSISMTKIQLNTGHPMHWTALFFSFARSLWAVQGWALVILLIIAGVLFFRRNRTKEKIPYMNSLSVILWSVLLAGLIIGPQLIIYLKSGIYERYLLPGIIGYVFIAILLLEYIRDITADELKNVPSIRWLYLVAAIILTFALVQSLRITRYTAVGFAREGFYTNNWLQTIRQNTRPQDVILVITDPVRCLEASPSLQAYLEYEMDRENVIFSSINITEPKRNSKFWKSLNRRFVSNFPEFSLDNEDDRNRIDAILVFPGLEKSFLKYSLHRFQLNKYLRYSNSAGFVSYYIADSSK